MTILDTLVETARQRVERRRAELPLETLESERRHAEPPRGFAAALAREPGISLIAEFKRRSPSAGEIRPGATVEEVTAAYETGGAAALSVLTEESGFGGSLADLAAARSATALPILRKDFTVDRYQLHEAAAAGADAVLLIVAALADTELAALHSEASDIGLDCLVEVHDQAELERALAIEPQLIGINNRDLTDFNVDVGTTFELLGRIPDGVVTVSESGIAEREQVAELERAGVDAVLVGETLMRAPDPEIACRVLTGA